MRLLGLELKRILKTRFVIGMLLGTVALTGIMSYAPISFVQYTYQDANGQEVTVKGLEAIRRTREDQKAYSGTMTPELAVKALNQYQDCANRYENGVYDDALKGSEYQKKIAPVSFLVSRLVEVYADSKSGLAPAPAELKEQDALHFYEQCRQHIVDLMEMEQKKHPEAKEMGIAMYENVKTPFSYYPGVDRNSIDYLGLMIFMMAVLGAVIAAPIFSIEYQTESDQILRCTRYGRGKLAAAKLVSCFLVLSLMYALCLTIFMVITNTAFGWDARQTDMQMVYSAVSFLPLTIGGMQEFAILAGFLTLLATLCFTLFLSSKCSSAFSASILALIFCILPIFINSFVGGNIGNWLRSILPSSGVGLHNSFLYAIMDPQFLYVGSRAVWVPYAMLAAAAVEIVLFIVLAVRTYCKRSR